MCDNFQKKLCNNNCDFCFNRSFASSEKAKFWSNKNEIIPREICKFSNKKFWFYCDKSNHEFENILCNITKGQWCPYPCCCYASKKICLDHDCKVCFNASFASSDKAKFWSKKNKLSPREVFKSSNKKFLFCCDKSNHEFECSLANVTRNFWCPYPCCTKGIKKLCKVEDCEICFIASFASSVNSEFWYQKLNINNEDEIIKPREVLKSSGEKYWFKCKNNHIFEISLHKIQRGNWCSKCSKNGYSKKAVKWLTSIMAKENIDIEHAENKGEYVIKTPCFISSVDGYCKETNTVYEFHGDFWHGNPKKFKPDVVNLVTKTTYGELYKNTIQREEKIRELGYNLIVIWESAYELENGRLRRM